MARTPDNFVAANESEVTHWHEAFFGVEFLLLHASPVYYGLDIPHGNGSGVMLIPGFLASDAYMFEMYAWLKRIGYQPYYSGIVLNAECPNLLLKQQLNRTIDQAVQETGGPIHIIGHSLGGIIARALAKLRPEDTASVISLGSPFRGRVINNKNVLFAAEMVRKFILMKNGSKVLPDCYTGRCTCNFVDSLRRDIPEDVPQTSVYTRHDGVVDWRYCRTGDKKVDVEVSGTHAGLAFNPKVYTIIATRLAETFRPELRPALKSLKPKEAGNGCRPR